METLFHVCAFSSTGHADDRDSVADCMTSAADDAAAISASDLKPVESVSSAPVEEAESVETPAAEEPKAEEPKVEEPKAEEVVVPELKAPPQRQKKPMR